MTKDEETLYRLDEEVEFKKRVRSERIRCVGFTKEELKDRLHDVFIECDRSEKWVDEVLAETINRQTLMLMDTEELVNIICRNREIYLQDEEGDFN